MKAKKMTETETHVFFWKSFLGQWTRSKFKDSDNIWYNTAEQYMMYHKAKLFGDVDCMRLIINESDPRAQKNLGRLVTGFNQAIWEENAISIVAQGNYLKFTQDDLLKEKLLATGDKILVEASPIDKIWGVGLSEDNPLINDEANWQGKNWLGIALMQARTRIKNEYESNNETNF